MTANLLTNHKRRIIIVRKGTKGDRPGNIVMKNIGTLNVFSISQAYGKFAEKGEGDKGCEVSARFGC